MADSSLIKRLGIKPGQRLLIVNAPPGYIDRLTPLPENATLTEQMEGVYDFVNVFVHNQAEVEHYAVPALQALKPGGLLWLAYPKRNSKVKTDLTRDIGWEAIKNAGYDAIAQVAVDETWTATRFRPLADIKRRGSAG